MQEITGPVVVGVDGPEPSRPAVEWAARFARLHQRPLLVVHAFLWPAAEAYLASSPEGPPGGGLRAEAERLLAAADTARAAAPGVEVSTELALQAPAAHLITLSHSASAIVVGHRGLGGFTGLLLGSVGVQVSAHAQCPVVVVRPSEDGTEAGQIVVGVDGSGHADAALEFAFGEASLRGTGLTAIRAWTVPLSSGPGDMIPLVYDPDVLGHEEMRALVESLGPWRDKYPGVPVRERVIHELPAKAITEASRGAELLVVGARGRGGFSGLLLGSVSQAAIHHAGCPVVVVRDAR